jgi:hypothetical protein
MMVCHLTLCCFFQGDSGGPVFRVVSGSYYQVGVVSWSEPNKIDPGVPDVMAQVPLNENGFDWIRQQVCGDWNVEATFCIVCEDTCDCPDNYECICYEEIEVRRRMEKKIDLLEDFLFPNDKGNNEETYDHTSLMPIGGKTFEKTQRGRNMKTKKNNNSGESSKSCKGGKLDKQCASDESLYCFRSDTALVDNF